MILADILARRFEEVYFDEFYRDIFQEGYLAEWETENPRADYPSGENWFYTAIAMEQLPETWEPAEPDKKPKHKTVRHAVYDDLAALHELVEDPKHQDNFIFMPTVSYVGYRRLNKNARQMFALCIEVDDLIVEGDKQEGLRFLFQMFENSKERKVIWNAQMPIPTYILCSGSGLHLYYVFDKPLNLSPSIFKGLGKLKKELTKRLWNECITTSYKKIQYEGICQPFRVLGTITKNGERTRAFRIGEKCDIDYLNSFVAEKHQVFLHYEKYQRAEGITPLPVAKKLWPEWYERVPARQREGKAPERKTWKTNRAMYDRLKERIPYEAKSGKRYNCLLVLGATALKCKISQEEYAADCWRLRPLLDFDTSKPFTDRDIEDVIKAYNSKDLVRTTVEAAAALSGMEFHRSKRNGREQKEHLGRIRTMQAYDDPEGSWRNKDGRPVGSGTAQDKVLEWRAAHPGGTKKQGRAETGLTFPTIRKWWDTAPKVITFEDVPATSVKTASFFDDWEIDLDMAHVQAAKEALGDAEEEN